MLSMLLASADVIEFHATEADSKPHLTNVKYSIGRLSREEKENSAFRIKHNNIIAWERTGV
jgi:hypothetical protein